MRVNLLVTIKEEARNIITIYLVADGRPRYRSFSCPFCQNKLGSIEGGQVVSMSDVFDQSEYPTNPKLTLYCNGKYCRTYYRFVLR